MRKILKSGNVSVSEDVFTIRDTAPRKPAPPPPESGAEEPAAAPVDEVPAEAFGSPEAEAIAEMIIQKAVEQADRIIGDAQQRAQAERAEVLHRAQMEAEAAKEQARKDGAMEGARTQVDAVVQCIAQIEEAISRIEGEQAGFMAEYEQNLKWLSLEIASKVLNKRLQQNDADIAELVRGAVHAVKGADKIIVSVSDSMPRLIDVLSNSLHTAEGGKVEVRDVPAEPGTCLIETPDAVVDASVYTQLENLKDYFKNDTL